MVKDEMDKNTRIKEEIGFRLERALREVDPGYHLFDVGSCLVRELGTDPEERDFIIRTMAEVVLNQCYGPGMFGPHKTVPDYAIYSGEEIENTMDLKDYIAVVIKGEDALEFHALPKDTTLAGRIAKAYEKEAGETDTVTLKKMK